MKYIALLFCFLFSSTIFAHNSRVAIFDVYEKEGVYRLDIQMHYEEILNALALKYENLSDNNLQDFVKEYISNALTIKFNHQLVMMQFTNYELTEESLALSVVLKSNEKSVTHIQIENKCLFEVQAEQNNMMRIFLNNKYKILNLQSYGSAAEILYE